MEKNCGKPIRRDMMQRNGKRSSDDIPEGEIYPRSGQSPFRQGVHVVFLKAFLHPKQTAIAQPDFEFLCRIFHFPDKKIALSTQTHGSYNRIWAKLRLIIAMPAHTVLPVAVIVNQHSIEAGSCGLLQPLADGFGGPMPGFRHHGLSGIAISIRRIALPVDQPGLIHPFPEHAYLRTLPVQLRL